MEWGLLPLSFSFLGGGDGCEIMHMNLGFMMMAYGILSGFSKIL